MCGHTQLKELAANWSVAKVFAAIRVLRIIDKETNWTPGLIHHQMILMGILASREGVTVDFPDDFDNLEETEAWYKRAEDNRNNDE